MTGLGQVLGAMLRTRRRRAAADQLYRTCKQAGTCPDDIIPKIEGSTTADKILQWGSAVTFFGGLGIGTGKGGGGATGYRPLGPVTPDVGVGTVRPPIPPEVVGVPESIPLDVLRPTDSSVVTGSEIPPVEIGVDSIDPPPDILEVPIRPDGPEAGQTDNNPAIIDSSLSTDTTPEAIEPKRPRVTGRNGSKVTSTTYNNPVFNDTHPMFNHNPETSLSTSVIIGNSDYNSSIGEAIELTTFPGPKESTPTRPVGRNTRGGLTSRRFVQRRLPSYTNILDLERAATSTNVFENPAYVDDSLDVTQPWSPPSSEFDDIYHLGRRVYSRVPSGRLAVSRVGQQSRMTLRSGVHIGPQVHYFGEISTIGDNSGVTVGVQASDSLSSPLQEYENIELDTFTGTYSEEDLLQEDVTDIHGHLVIGTGTQSTGYPVPDIAIRRPFAGLPPTVQDITEGPWSHGDGVYVDHSGNAVDPSTPLSPATEVWTEIYSNVWDPSLFKRKRKRMYI